MELLITRQTINRKNQWHKQRQPTRTPHGAPIPPRLVLRCVSAISTNIIGHSWGGARSATVAKILASEGVVVETLITVDPVSRNWARTDASSSAISWVNINATPSKSNYFGGDIWATLGGKWGEWPQDKAGTNYDSPFHHNEFGNLFNYSNQNGVSGLSSLLNSKNSNPCSCK